MNPTHTMAALALGIALPGGSLIFGTGDFAYGMYADAAEIRLAVTAVAESGRRRPIAAAELVRGAAPSLVPYLAGAEQWRTRSRGADLRSALPSLVAHACEALRTRRPASVEIVLEERARGGGAVRSTRAEAMCVR